MVLSPLLVACFTALELRGNYAKAIIILKQELFFGENWPGIMQMWPLSYPTLLTRWLAGLRRQQRFTPQELGAVRQSFNFSLHNLLLLFAFHDLTSCHKTGTLLLRYKRSHLSASCFWEMTPPLTLQPTHDRCGTMMYDPAYASSTTVQHVDPDERQSMRWWYADVLKSRSE